MCRSYHRAATKAKGGFENENLKEENLRSLEFWSGAADTVKYLTDDEMDTIETRLEDIYPDGIGETELNDLFWFDDDTIAEWIGYESFEQIMERENIA